MGRHLVGKRPAGRDIVGSERDTPGEIDAVCIGLVDHVRFERRLDDYLSGSDNILSAREDAINDAIENLEDQIDSKELILEKRQSALTAKFTRMETLISQLQTQQNSLSSLSYF